MKTTLDLIDAAIRAHPAACVAFSGGTDSLVLLDIMHRYTPHRPPVLFADSQMEYPETLPFIRETCERYGAALHVARAQRTPLDQWRRHGWPMLGKLAARKWMQAHRQRGFGFRLDVSACCRSMKIAPARRLMRELGLELQFTGQRGQTDDALRGLRQIKDGATFYHKGDKIWLCNPLAGWSDMMIRRYVRQHRLPEHPAKAKGAETIGCVYCGGGAQFTNSGFRILRRTWPAAWRRLMVDWRAGEIVLTVKYDRPLPVIREAICELGGLDRLAREKPWLFDFIRTTPLQGYAKSTTTPATPRQGMPAAP
jgi:3'-phosphoadenosine 5'-phosphosulfate sulfotransferase (PAPS reductase)/FAD synthetase